MSQHSARDNFLIFSSFLMLLRPSLVIRYPVVIGFRIPVVFSHFLFPSSFISFVRFSFQSSNKLLCTLAFSLAGRFTFSRIRTGRAPEMFLKEIRQHILCGTECYFHMPPSLFAQQYTRQKLLNTGQQFEKTKKLNT